MPLSGRWGHPRRTVPRDQRGSRALARVRRLPRVRHLYLATGHRDVGELPRLPHSAVPPDESPDLV